MINHEPLREIEEERHQDDGVCEIVERPEKNAFLVHRSILSQIAKFSKKMTEKVRDERIELSPGDWKSAVLPLN